jgi:hypothetical protein
LVFAEQLFRVEANSASLSHVAGNGSGIRHFRVKITFDSPPRLA